MLEVNEWSILFGMGLSLFVEFVPYVRERFGRLSPTGKQRVLAVLLIAGGAVNIMLSQEAPRSVLDLIGRFLVALAESVTANQGVHALIGWQTLFGLDSGPAPID